MCGHKSGLVVERTQEENVPGELVTALYTRGQLFKKCNLDQNYLAIQDQVINFTFILVCQIPLD